MSKKFKTLFISVGTVMLLYLYVVLFTSFCYAADLYHDPQDWGACTEYVLVPLDYIFPSKIVGCWLAGVEIK